MKIPARVIVNVSSPRSRGWPYLDETAAVLRRSSPRSRAAGGICPPCYTIDIGNDIRYR
jgi:hypothetical protein